MQEGDFHIDHSITYDDMRRYADALDIPYAASFSFPPLE